MQAPENGRIRLKSLKEINFLSDLDAVPDDYLICQQACSRICSRSSSFEHVAIYWRRKENSGMDALATLIALNSQSRDEFGVRGGLNDHHRPVVVICCYANSDAGYDMSIYMNRTADEHLKPRLLEAEEVVMTSACYSKTSGQFPKPSSGEWVLSRVGGKPKARIFQRSRMTDGLVCGKHFLMDDSSVIRLPPRRKAYGLHTALSMIEECCRLARIPEEKLFLVTLSKRRLRDGLSMGTWDGRLCPKVILCPRISAKGDAQQDLAQTLGALARVCCPRNGSFGARPEGHPIIVARAQDIRHMGCLHQQSDDGLIFTGPSEDFFLPRNDLLEIQMPIHEDDVPPLSMVNDSKATQLASGDDGSRHTLYAVEGGKRCTEISETLDIDEADTPPPSISDDLVQVQVTCSLENHQSWKAKTSARPLDGWKSKINIKRPRRESESEVSMDKKSVLIDLTGDDSQGNSRTLCCSLPEDNEADCCITGYIFDVDGGSGGYGSVVAHEKDGSGSAAKPICVG